MNKYEKIQKARKTLELPDHATMDQIKASYRSLLCRWHPDRCPHDHEMAAMMTRKITEAYKSLMDYCTNYKYCFSEETVKRRRSPGELWMERFGNAPLWSEIRKKTGDKN